MASSHSWVSILETLTNNQNLSGEQSHWAMEQMIAGKASSAEIASFLLALKAKGETVSEIIGFREAVLEHAVTLHCPSDALDIVGTGGDNHHTVNISTTASIVAAATGVPVIKHGNRAATSSSGASDVLNALGLNLDLSNQQVAEVLHNVGITFAFASAFHPGFRHVGPTRAELGVPTVFNILGPLCNPARPEASAVGVAQLDRIPLITGVFQQKGATALVFRGDDGLDELTTTTSSQIWEISLGKLQEHTITPQLLNLEKASLEDIRGGSPERNAEILQDTLNGRVGPVRDIVVLNAAAGLTAYELYKDPAMFNQSLVDRLLRNMDQAAEAIDSGKATRKLNDWISQSNSF